MLSKLFGSTTIKLCSLRKPAPAASAVPAPPAPPGEHPHQPNPSRPLRIVHAGGHVECYYMAIPAAGIMEKYPRAVLARPDVFRRPWDSLVQPGEILIPGEKVYVVPRRTIQKLQRRIRRPAAHGRRGDSSEGKNESNTSGKSTTAPAAAFKLLGFSFAWPERKKVDASVNGRPAAAPRVRPRRRRVRMAGMWQPSLEAIHEASPLAAPPLPHPSQMSH